MSEQIRRLSSSDAGFTATLDALLAFEGSTDAAIDQAVADILQAVRRDGDQAVVAFTRRFDHVDVADMAALELPRAELEAALAHEELRARQALQFKAEREERKLRRLEKFRMQLNNTVVEALESAQAIPPVRESRLHLTTHVGEICPVLKKMQKRKHKTRRVARVRERRYGKEMRQLIPPDEMEQLVLASN